MGSFLGSLVRCVTAVAVVALILRFTGTDLPSDEASWVLWLFLGALLAGLLGAMLRYRHPSAHAASTLGKAEDELRSGGARPMESDARGVADRSAPTAFAKHKSLREAWEGFAAARSGSDSSPAAPEQLTVSPTDHLTVDAALGRKLGRLPDALPGVFTAVGLLGTFVGIALGLADIEPTAGTEDLMEGIRTLMGGMSTAFLTSIVGIMWSVWWLFEWRFAERRLRIKLDGFVTQAVQANPVEEPHATLVRIVQAQEQVRDIAKEVKGNLQSLGQDMAEALEPYFEKHIAAPIRELNTDLGQRQTQALKQMVDEFRATLVSSVQDELSAFGQSLRDATDHQVDAARRLARFFDRLDEVSNQQTKLLESTTEVATVFDLGLDRLNAATIAIEAAGRSAGETMAAASEATKATERVAAESRRQLDSLAEVSKEARRFQEAHSDLLGELAAGFSRLANDLGEKIAEFRTLAAQKIGEVFHVFDSEMAKVVDHLGGTLAELRDVTEELPRTVGRLQEAAHELAEEGRTQRSTLVDGLRAFEEARDGLAELFDRTSAESQELSGRLATAASEMIQGQTDFAAGAQRIQRGMEAMADRVDKAGARSSADFKRLVDSVGSATDRLDGMANAVGDDMKPLARQTEAASEGLEKLSARVGDLIDVLGSPQRTAQGLHHAGGNPGSRVEDFAGQGRDGRPRSETSPTNVETSSVKIVGVPSKVDSPPSKVEDPPVRVEASAYRGAGGARVDKSKERGTVVRDATRDGATAGATTTAGNATPANQGDAPAPPRSFLQRLFRRGNRR